jgi:sodium transport system permease protein
MNRFVIGLIANRETRDLWRDRRTVIVILVLPLVLYPVFGLVSWLFALSLTEQTSRVGVVGLSHLAKDRVPLIKDDHFSEELVKGPEAADALTRLSPVPLEGTVEAAEEILKARSVDVVLVIPRRLQQAGCRR